uniref:Beta-adaptin appendage C-terminal subdomain domain-containing protein n=1 Tax=Ananas comosus var. bracteatus TaxID=296719 RepID=A0A6V7PGX9_ANACO|nr:unnamed protein product [Ananas comosus var. bracteatus]
MAPPLVTLLSAEPEIQYVDCRTSILLYRKGLLYFDMRLRFSSASITWVIGEYAERIDNAYELFESFLDSFPEEPALAVLNNATVETDNPDLRDRAYIYCRHLSTDPEAAKDVVLAEKPSISDDVNLLDPSLLDELLANIGSLSSVYHKPPEAFESRARTAALRTDDEEYPDGGETAYSESPSHAADAVPALVTASGTSAVTHAAARQLASPATDPVQLLCRICLIVLDGFMTQFNKNAFGFVAAVPLQVPPLQPGALACTLLPMILLQNVLTGPPSALSQRRNASKELLYLSTKIPLGIPFLIKLSTTVGIPRVKCALNMPGPELAPLIFEAMETLLT